VKVVKKCCVSGSGRIPIILPDRDRYPGHAGAYPDPDLDLDRHRIVLSFKFASCNQGCGSDHRIHMFLGLLDPDPLVRGMDPDPSIIKQKW
jgi:hypothetical protein